MRILVVEDEPMIANAIKRGLEQESFAVDIALDGEVGYDLLSTEEYDVAVVDRMLPKLDGAQLCTKLRTEHIATPVLMLTARAELEDKVSGLNAGADDYLTKPFAFEELVARIKALARRPQQALGTRLTYDDIVLDTTALTVQRAGQPIELSKKEFALLEYLLRNKQRTVSKDQIISHVWNFDADVLPNTVEVYIGYLRTKLDKPFKKKTPTIQTVRGFGYKLGT